MYFDTNDLYLAAFLQASGHALCRNQRQGDKVLFSYTHSPELAKLVEEYYDMNASVNPLHYGSALKILKNILYQKDNNNNHNNDNQQFTHPKRKA